MRGRFQVTPGFWLMAALVWVVDPQLILPAALAAGLHEGGHLAALLALGSRPRRLRLTAAGLDLSLRAPLSYRRELFCSAAGPVVSLLAALPAARAGHFLFAGVSLALGLFNLIPIPPLDGGRVARAVCALVFRPETSLRVSRGTALAAGGLALGLAAAAFWRFGGLGVLLAGGWLAWRGIFGEKDP